MKSPESYRKEYPKSAQEKFAIPRDKDGEPNQEVFGITKDFVGKLSKYPSFVGAAPYGSKMRGYSRENSDTDVAIFTDTDPVSNIENTELYSLQADALEATYAHGGPDKVHTEYYAINEEIIKQAIINPNFYPGRIALVNFLGIAAGPKVEQYRKIFAELVNALPEAKRDKFIKDMVLMALSLENSRTSTVEKRITETKEIAMETIRKPVWEKRIADLLKTK